MVALEARPLVQDLQILSAAREFTLQFLQHIPDYGLRNSHWAHGCVQELRERCLAFIRRR